MMTLQYANALGSVLFIPDVAIDSSLAWFASESTWPRQLFCTSSMRSRLIEFQYQINITNQFSWAKFIDLGATLIDCMLEKANDFQVCLVGNRLP